MAELALRPDARVTEVVHRTHQRIVAEHRTRRRPTTIRHTPLVAHLMPARRTRQAAEHRTAAEPLTVAEHRTVVAVEDMPAAAVEDIARPWPQ
jgi:hypothetical protein